MQKVIILMLCNGEKILYNNDNKGGDARAGEDLRRAELPHKENNEKSGGARTCARVRKKGECDYG